MTSTDLLDAWRSAPENERRAVVDGARRRAEAACEAACVGYPSEVLCAPVVEVLAAQRREGRLVATTATHFRVYFFAQSGSDWGAQHVTIAQAVVDESGTVAERIACEEATPLGERESDDYDDAAAARQVVDAFVARGGLER